MSYSPPSTILAENSRALTAAATINPNDFAQFTITSTTVATIGTFTPGQYCDIRNAEASTANVTLTPPSGGSFNGGAANATLPIVPGQDYTILCDAANSFRIK